MEKDQNISKVHPWVNKGKTHRHVLQILHSTFQGKNYDVKKNKEIKSFKFFLFFKGGSEVLKSEGFRTSLGFITHKALWLLLGKIDR